MTRKIDWAISVASQLVASDTIELAGEIKWEVTVPKASNGTSGTQKVNLGVASTNTVQFLLISPIVSDATKLPQLSYTVDAGTTPIVMDATAHLFIGSGFMKAALGDTANVITFSNDSSQDIPIKIYAGLLQAPNLATGTTTTPSGKDGQ